MGREILWMFFRWLPVLSLFFTIVKNLSQKKNRGCISWLSPHNSELRCKNVGIKADMERLSNTLKCDVIRRPGLVIIVTKIYKYFQHIVFPMAVSNPVLPWGTPKNWKGFFQDPKKPDHDAFLFFLHFCQSNGVWSMKKKSIIALENCAWFVKYYSIHLGVGFNSVFIFTDTLNDYESCIVICALISTFHLF